MFFTWTANSVFDSILLLFDKMPSTTSANIDILITEIGGVTFPSGSILKVEYVNGKKEGAGKVHIRYCQSMVWQANQG